MRCVCGQAKRRKQSPGAKLARLASPIMASSRKDTSARISARGVGVGAILGTQALHLVGAAFFRIPLFRSPPRPPPRPFPSVGRELEHPIQPVRRRRRRAGGRRRANRGRQRRRGCGWKRRQQVEHLPPRLPRRRLLVLLLLVVVVVVVLLPRWRLLLRRRWWWLLRGGLLAGFADEGGVLGRHRVQRLHVLLHALHLQYGRGTDSISIQLAQPQHSRELLVLAISEWTMDADGSPASASAP